MHAVLVTVREILASLFLLSAGTLFIYGITAGQTDSTAAQRISPPPLRDSLYTVGTVMVIGNSLTKDFVITREMSLQPGRLITRDLLLYDQNRIMSLGLFNEVRLLVIPPRDSLTAADLVVEVHERWYFFPYPILGIKDRDWSKVYYGAGLLHSNFRGQNEKLNTALILGYDPAVICSYRTPFLGRSGNDFLETRFSYSTVTNKSLLAQDGLPNFDENHISAYLTLGKRFGILQTIWITTGFEHVHISDYLPGRTLSPDGTDNYPVIGSGYLYDSRDLAEYPSRGTLARATVTKYGFPGKTIDFVRYSADLRQFIPLTGGVTLAGRTFTDLVAAGPTPSYNRDYFGYGERIRGHYKEVTEGESIAGFSAELRTTLFPVHYLEVPYLPRQFALWRFGISAVIFGDAGTVWFRRTPFALDRFSKGYGVGLNFLLPYSAVLRTEYAWDESRHGEFIIDVGALL